MDSGLVSPPLQIHRPEPNRSKAVESEIVESQAVESETVELIGGKDDESDTDVSLFDESDTDESDTEKLIGRECEYCLKVGVHFTQTCPYKYHVPKNAIVSKRCVVVCNFCGCLFRDSCCGSCGISDGCAVLMDCLHCGKIGEHLTFTCPSREGKPSYFFCDPYTGSCRLY
ncbi:PREDICTED: uncharacterized protein LOC103323494 [Prunus mume]|uniref:Uncharacterized protein LOC103323494 n=1 Tax=Prunus mume TaxID=102107 RepID=A0ABM0NET4_PRUMU|nr:PREDICTED: uncharacterized protein LOC103323494 [Prunus mume]